MKRLVSILRFSPAKVASNPLFIRFCSFKMNCRSTVTYKARLPKTGSRGFFRFLGNFLKWQVEHAKLSGACPWAGLAHDGAWCKEGAEKGSGGFEKL
jgi:hypothetical protein